MKVIVLKQREMLRSECPVGTLVLPPQPGTFPLCETGLQCLPSWVAVTLNDSGYDGYCHLPLGHPTELTDAWPLLLSYRYICFLSPITRL